MCICRSITHIIRQRIDYDYYLYLKQHANSDGTINKDNNTGDSTNGTDNVGGKTDDLDKTDAADKTKEA